MEYERIPALNYYEILGIDRNASPEEIKSAYRQAALKHHPDKNKDNKAAAEEQFKKINEAYSVLNDPAKKQQYDSFGTVQNGRMGFNPFENGDPFDGFFESFFGHRRHRTGEDIRFKFQITLEDVALGNEKQFSYDRNNICEHCKGFGGSGSVCTNCNGHGQMQFRHGFVTTTAQCPHCKGLGKQITKQCNNCKGKGVISEHRTIGIKIPIGIEDGQTMKFSGGGHQTQPGMPYGDLYCIFKIKEHPVFKRKNNDLYCEKTISMTQACLGDTISVATLTGNQVEVKIPVGTQPMSTLKVKGKGIKNGHLYIEINVNIPHHFTEKAKHLLQELNAELNNTH